MLLFGYLRRPWLALLASILLVILSAHAQATVLGLPNSWTGGSPAAGQTASQTFTNSGQTVTISVNNNGTATSGANWSSGYPAFNSTETTGGFSGQVGLQLYATGTSSTSAFVLTTVKFAQPVNNLSFQIWDIDKSAGQFVDTISEIKAIDFNGAALAPSSVVSANTSYTSVTGSGFNFLVNGTAGATNTTNQGTVTVSFTTGITQFSFKWSNTDPGIGQQAIGLGQINFTAIPEVSALWPIAGLLAAGCVVRLIQRSLGTRA